MRGAADSGSNLAHDLLFAVAPLPIVENTMKTRVIACDDTVRSTDPSPSPNIGRRPLQTRIYDDNDTRIGEIHKWVNDVA